ncbi:MAG: bifunctional phosphopantothenoylcysteine decarboxylase/phosphopantothenate--cysteine ligase CoaBC [Bacilli bacterium]|nr:bifunctional phosphopantothenoylcysteine decarboxylase/phosphopantothenate--cysteine ligase CoaBC [Bacilli bacterium]
MFKNKNILIGVTGGISAYKVCDIVSALKHKGANVNVIMSKNATKFITALTLETLSKNKVYVEMFDGEYEEEVRHISLARNADIVLVAPCSANVIGKLANGIADDMLTTTLIATKAQVVIAPAMNDNMYSNLIVQDNIRKLKEFGYKFIEPDTGNLACGYIGKGKLAKKEVIFNYLESVLRGDNND